MSGSWWTSSVLEAVGDPGYTIRKDADMSGTVDSADITHANSIVPGGGYQTLGRDVLSSTGVENHRGYAGYTRDDSATPLYHVRHRVLHTTLGRWTKRDPLGYVDGRSGTAVIILARQKSHATRKDGIDPVSVP